MVKITLADQSFKDKHNLSDTVYVMTSGDEQLGYCEFNMTPPTVLLKTAVCDTPALLDGIIRQSLSYAFDHDCKTALFTDSVKQQLLMLKIIQSETENQIDILSFFTKPCNCH
ncbi:MAG: hypothetical protein IJF54_03860 [Clostridia bacterium]|nr:hypothetical protein [Clostridia bacterium]